MKNLIQTIVSMSFVISSAIYSQGYGSYNQGSGGGYSDGSNSPSNMEKHYAPRAPQSPQSAQTQAYYPSSVGYQNNSQNYQNGSDASVNSAVLERLRNSPYLEDSRHIKVETKDGQVTLSGKVADKHEKGEIEIMIKNIPGVKSVKNDLETGK